MVAAVIAYPKLVIDGIDQGVTIDADKALESMTMPTLPTPAAAPAMDLGNVATPGAASAGSAPSLPVPSGGLPSPTAPTPSPAAAEDPMKALLEAVKEDAQKKK
jgi:hypothetical protein